MVKYIDEVTHYQDPNKQTKNTQKVNDNYPSPTKDKEILVTR